MKRMGFLIVAAVLGCGFADAQSPATGAPLLILEPEGDATVWMVLELPSEPAEPDRVTQAFAAVLKETDPEYIAEMYDGTVYEDGRVTWSDYWYHVQEVEVFRFAGELELEPLRDALRAIDYQQLHIEVVVLSGYTTKAKWSGEVPTELRESGRYTAVLPLESPLPRLRLECAQTPLTIARHFLPAPLLTAVFACFILWLRWYLLRWPAEEAGYASYLCTRLLVSGVIAFWILLGCFLVVWPPVLALSASTLVEVGGKLTIGLWAIWVTVATVLARIYLRPIYLRLPGACWTRRNFASQAFWCCALMVASVLSGTQLRSLLMNGPLHVMGGLLVMGVLILCLYARVLRAFDFRFQALLEGELRDRIDAMAKDANIRSDVGLSVLYRRCVASVNAFVFHRSHIVLTDELVRGLSRREIEGIIAHEMTHLVKRHPGKLYQRRNLLVALGVVLGAGTGYILYSFLMMTRFWEQIFSLQLLFYTVGGLVGAQVGLLYFYAYCRRCEYEADAGALNITGDAEGLIAGLLKFARQNLLPLDWGKGWGSWLLTHPAMRARVERVAARGGVTPERLGQLLKGDTVGEGHYPIPSSAEGTRIFTTQLKHSMNNFSLLIFMVESALLPAVIAYAGKHLLGAALPTLVILPLMAVSSFLTILACQNWTSMRGLAAVGRRLRERFEISPACGTYVTMSPGETPRVFDASVHWDAGFLAWDHAGLHFLGDAMSFTLSRESIVDMVLVAKRTTPLFQTRVRVEYERAGYPGTVYVSFTTADGHSLVTSNKNAQKLFAALENWHSSAAQEGGIELPGAPYPPPESFSVRGTPLPAVYGSPQVLLLVTLATITGFALGGALQLNEWKPFGSSMFIVGLASGLGALLTYFPAWLRTRGKSESTGT